MSIDGSIFEDDSHALAVIENRFLYSGGVIRPEELGIVPNVAEEMAIYYLCEEWDYDYDPEYRSDKP